MPKPTFDPAQLDLADVGPYRLVPTVTADDRTDSAVVPIFVLDR